MLVNKYKENIGVYIVKMNMNKPMFLNEDGKEELNGEFIINWTTKLDIDDCGM